MKKGKNPNMLVLAVEIAAIVVLHAIKLNQAEKTVNNKEISKNTAAAAANQPVSRMNTSYSMTVFK